MASDFQEAQADGAIAVEGEEGQAKTADYTVPSPAVQAFSDFAERAGILKQYSHALQLLPPDATNEHIVAMIRVKLGSQACAQKLFALFQHSQSTGGTYSVPHLGLTDDDYAFMSAGSGGFGHVVGYVRRVDSPTQGIDTEQMSETVRRSLEPELSAATWTKDDGTIVELEAGKVVERRPQDVIAFERELRGLSLDLPFVPHPLGAGVTHDGVPFIRMQYIMGEDLSRILKCGALPTHARRDALAQIFRMAAMFYAAKENFVHRDIKPANLAFTHDGLPKLFDMGLARSVHTTQSPDSAGSTQDGVVKGTFDYMAPEVANAQRATVSSDIFSFGALAIELGTGRVPYKIDNTDLMAVHCARVNISATERVDLPREENEHDPRNALLRRAEEAFLQMTIDPNPTRRPTPRACAAFYHAISSFRIAPFEDWTALASYRKYHLDLTTASAPEERSPQPYGSPENLRTALIEGAEERANALEDGGRMESLLEALRKCGTDGPALVRCVLETSGALREEDSQFLDVHEQGKTAEKKLRLRALMRKAGVGVSIAAAVSLAVSQAGKIFQKKENAPDQGNGTTEVIPSAPQSQMHLEFDEQGQPIRLQLFAKDPVIYEKEMLIPLFSNGSVNGLVFGTSREQMAKFKQIEFMPYNPDWLKQRKPDPIQAAAGVVLFPHKGEAPESTLGDTLLISGNIGSIVNLQSGESRLFTSDLHLRENRRMGKEKPGVVEDAYKDKDVLRILQGTPTIKRIGNISPEFRATFDMLTKESDGMTGEDKVRSMVNSIINNYRISAEQAQAVNTAAVSKK
ncbi:MAG: protein kinase [Candidatus Peregrinibacteria bacterium]|nr:protein kinase [Candidatus Peregrinibacteria bacterium]